MVFYAVAKGHTTGLFNTWIECKRQIDGFKGAIYKKFDLEKDANDFILNPPIRKAAKNSIQEITDTIQKPDYYVYTDGSCSNNGRADAKAGIGIYFGENDSRNVSQPIQGKQSNNTAELSAIIHAHKIIASDIANGKQIAIVSDSEYAIRCATTYGMRCAKAGWVVQIPNMDLVKTIYELYKDKPNVKFLHIMAHTERSDIHSLGNEGADRLANQSIGFSGERKTKLYLYVPFEMKEQAKGKGAIWDFKKKQWYIYSDNPHKDELKQLFG